MRGTGKGGQARNKTSNAVRMTHIPSGLVVRVETTRSQHENREIAMRVLAARLHEQESSHKSRALAQKRRNLIGSGQRGDKIRTIRLQDNTVTDHQTGKSVSASKYLKGEIKSLISEKA